jgi:nucleotide-binding universal stress UspA family protein
MFKKILVATDGSELSDKAVAHAVELARAHGAALLAFTVVRRYARSYMEGSIVQDIAESERIDEERMKRAQQMLDTVRARAQAQQVACETQVVHSSRIAESIIETADARGCDVIVMSSHGRKGIGRLLLGSETLHVLTHTSLPVLVLR